MHRSIRTAASLALLGLGVALLSPNQAEAYSCKSQFEAAQELIQQAEKLVKEDTDSRVLGMIAEAKGLAEAGIVSHDAASQKHTGHDGKFMHSDAVRKGLWAQELAKQALFLLTGEVQ